jgi:hypothetical protein
MARKEGEKLPETKRVTATIHGELFDAIEKLADKQGRTVSSLVAHGMEVFMSQYAPTYYPLDRSVKGYAEPNDDDEDE